MLSLNTMHDYFSFKKLWQFKRISYHLIVHFLYCSPCCFLSQILYKAIQGRIQDLIGGGAQIVTGLKLPFWGLSFVEFWCWGLIFGGQGGGGPGPPAPPWIRPCNLLTFYIFSINIFVKSVK